MVRPNLDTLIANFDRDFDTSFEAAAAQQRGAFLKAFPLRTLKTLTLGEYVIGKGRPSFCAYIEPKTSLWANILGATSFKFGIYFGKTKSDPTQRYRFQKRFGDTKETVFAAVKKALLQLIDDGAALRFEEIDDNPLSQMFKAKILSLYFPDAYLNVCSSEHIGEIAAALGHDEGWISERQNFLLQVKLQNPKTRDWSNPKFMAFLYNTYLPYLKKPLHLKGTQARRPPKINIDDMLERRNQIGKTSERYALQWEQERLQGLGYDALAEQIEDCRDRPGYGYDFSSYTAPNVPRFIEVKTAGKNWKGDGIRFFLSLTECEVSKKPECRDNYYFYLVYYDDGEPIRVREWLAAELYKAGEFGPNGYVVALNDE